jgi:hypothetical protein
MSTELMAVCLGVEEVLVLVETYRGSGLTGRRFDLRERIGAS